MYIEGNKIYPQRNREIINAIKQLNDDSLNDILSDVSVNVDYVAALAKLSKFLENRRTILEKVIDKKQVDIFFEFVNNYGIKHSKNNNKGEPQKTPTKEQLQIFFDFGLSIARLSKNIEERSCDEAKKSDKII